MRTTVEIDDQLLRSVQRDLPGLTKRELIHQALLALRRTLASAALATLGGTENIREVPRQ